MRRRLLTNLAKFDPPSANRLADEQDGYFGSPLDADDLNEETREQIARKDFDRFSGAQHVGSNEAMILLSILDELRKKDVKVGDELFLNALTRVRGQQNVEANTLLILGNYLFSGHPLPFNETVSRIMVSPVQVGGTPLAADVVLNRDNFSSKLATPYLTTAAGILSRPVEDAGEQRRYSAAAFLLLPKAKEFAPDLVATFAAVAQRSDAGLTADTTGRSEVKRWTNEKIDVEVTLAQIRKTVGASARDRLCLTAAAQYSAQKDLDAARRIANEMTDEAARGKLLSIIDYERATKYLEDGDYIRSEETGARISSEPIRALFYNSLAAAHLKRGRTDSTKLAVNNAITDARQSADAARRPILLMTVDAAGYPGRQPQIIDFGWVETVSAGGPPARFELRPAAGLPSYQELLKNLFIGGRPSAVTAVLSLKTEALLSAHLIAASRILFETGRKATPSNGSGDRS